MENFKIPLTNHGIYIFFSVLKYFLFCESLRSLYNDNDISKSLSWKSVHGNSLVRKCGNPGNLNSSPFTCKTETVLVLKWVTANTFLQMFHKILLAATIETNYWFCSNALPCIFCCLSALICPPKCFKRSATLSLLYIPILYIKMCR